MKTFIIYFLVLFAFVSCENSSDSKYIGPTSSDTVLTEVYDDLSAITLTSHNSAILKLEGSQSHSNDTVKTGSDTVNLYIQSDESRTFCINDLENRGHKVSIRNASNEILESLTQGCSTLNLKEGYYNIEIENADKADDITHTVFITSNIENNPLYTHMLNEEETIARDVSSSSLQKKTLINFNVCKNCNLSKAKLHNLAFDSLFDKNNLSPRVNNDYFKILDTTEEEFFSEQNKNENHSKQKLDISGSTLNGADLSYSLFRDATFNGVDFSDANLSHTVFIDCSFDGAIFDKADMTKAFFIRPKFAKNSQVKNRANSKVSAAQLSVTYETTKHDWTGKNITEHKYEYEYLSSFIIHENLMGLYIKKYNERTLSYKTAPNAPGTSNSLYFESSPSVVRLNHYLDYAVFARLSDGYIWSYKSRLKKWERLVDSNKCKSAPSAVSWDDSSVDASKNEPDTRVLVTCHDMEGRLYSWDRYFHQDDDPAAWTQNSFPIDKVKGNVFVNALGTIAYIKDHKLYRVIMSDLPQQNDSPFVDVDIMSISDVTSNENLSFSAEPSLQAFTYNVAVVMSDGNLYVGDKAGEFSNFGHPDGGIITAPSFAKVEIEDKRYREKIILLNGESEIYYYDVDVNGFSWTPFEINQEIEKDIREYNLQFTHNIFNFTYLDTAALNNVDFSTNNMANIFLNASYFDFSSFNGMDLNETYFYDSFFDQADFSGSNVDGLTWHNNSMVNSLFNEVSFSDKKINSKMNRFKIHQYITSFKNVKNIPVELFYGSESKVYDATILEDYDFTGATFKNLDALNFHNVTLKNLHFREANLSRLDAGKSSFLNSDLSYVKGENINFDNTEFERTNFYQSQINNSSFIASQWREVNASYGIFQTNDMHDINISNSDISHASFNDSNLSIAKMDADVNAKNSTFVRASLQAVFFHKVDFSGSNFSDASFDPLYNWSLFEQVNSDISSSNLSSTHFNNANIRCADMRGVLLSNASLEDANLSGVDLSSLPVPQQGYFEKTDFSGANFQDTDMGSSDLTGAIFDFSGRNISFENGDDNFSCPGYTTKPSF